MTFPYFNFDFLVIIFYTCDPQDTPARNISSKTVFEDPITPKRRNHEIQEQLLTRENMGCVSELT